MVQSVLDTVHITALFQQLQSVFMNTSNIGLVLSYVVAMKNRSEAILQLDCCTVHVPTSETYQFVFSLCILVQLYTAKGCLTIDGQEDTVKNHLNE